MGASHTRGFCTQSYRRVDNPHRGIMPDHFEGHAPEPELECATRPPKLRPRISLSGCQASGKSNATSFVLRSPLLEERS